MFHDSGVVSEVNVAGHGHGQGLDWLDCDDSISWLKRGVERMMVALGDVLSA